MRLLPGQTSSTFYYRNIGIILVQSIVRQRRTDDLDELVIFHVLAIDVRLSAQFIHLFSRQLLSPTGQNVLQIVYVNHTYGLE